MSSSGQTRRSSALVLYLELAAAGVTLLMEERPDNPCGYALVCSGMKALPSSRRRLFRDRVGEHRAALAGMVLAHESECSGDLKAIREEAIA